MFLIVSSVDYLLFLYIYHYWRLPLIFVYLLGLLSFLKGLKTLVDLLLLLGSFL